MENNFLSFVKKESLHILRDRRTMLIVIPIPIVLMVLFDFAMQCLEEGKADAIVQIPADFERDMTVAEPERIIIANAVNANGRIVEQLLCTGYFRHFLQTDSILPFCGSSEPREPKGDNTLIYFNAPKFHRREIESANTGYSGT